MDLLNSSSIRFESAAVMKAGRLNQKNLVFLQQPNKRENFVAPLNSRGAR